MGFVFTLVNLSLRIADSWVDLYTILDEWNWAIEIDFFDTAVNNSENFIAYAIMTQKQRRP